MGLRDFWDRLTGGDKVERVEEELEDDRVEEPARVEDYEGDEGRHALSRSVSEAPTSTRTAASSAAP